MKLTKRTKKLLAIFSVIVLMLCMVTPAFADTNDPIAVVNNLSEFIFGLIRAVGIILLAFGIVQVGLALKSHDASQRANGFLTVAGGIIITFAREILNLIMGSAYEDECHRTHAHSFFEWRTAGSDHCGDGRRERLYRRVQRKTLHGDLQSVCQSILCR